MHSVRLLDLVCRTARNRARSPRASGRRNCQSAPMHLVHNEQTKLTATWFNTLATALIAAGAVAPVAAILYGLAALPVPPGRLIALALACLGLGSGLHIVARAQLGNLRE